MLSVLLKILAVVGILLLVILGIIIFVLLIILFVPITYRIIGNADQKTREVHVRAKWLFGLLRFRLSYTKEIAWNLKILWMDVKGHLKKKTTENNVRPKSFETMDAAVSPSEDIHVSEEIPVSEDSSQSENTSVKKTLSETIDDIIKKIQRLIEKFQEILANLSYYLEVLREEDTTNLITIFFGMFGRILNGIRPRKLKVNAVIGFDSPDTTGKVYGFLCMLYPYYGNDIHITPDFDNKILEVNLYAKGHICICVLVWNALKILLNRKLYKVIHKFKNGGKKKNGR